MKHIKAVIRPEMLDVVLAALKQIGAYRGITVSEVMGHGNQQGVEQSWRGEKYHLDLLQKVMLDMIVNDDEADSIKKTIIDSVRTGEKGDGKIFIYDVQEAIRIRTGEEGDDSL
jgi:nitrogen regulatory protein PII